MCTAWSSHIIRLSKKALKFTSENDMRSQLCSGLGSSPTNFLRMGYTDLCINGTLV